MNSRDINLQLFVDRLTEKRSWIRQKQQEWVGDYRIDGVSFKFLFCRMEKLDLRVEFGPWCMPHVMFWIFGIAGCVGWYFNSCNPCVKANGFGRSEWREAGLRLSSADEYYFACVDEEAQ